jgi:cytochrome P450
MKQETLPWIWHITATTSTSCEESSILTNYDPISFPIDTLESVQDLLVAGTETCSTTIEWAMTELMRHPEAMRQVQAEVESVVGKERLVQESDTPNLPRLQAFVKEVFRMHPPVAMSIPRESTREVELSGFTIPAGTRLMVNLFAIHRDPSVYESPDEFRPERFLGQPDVLATSAFDHYQLEPYGAGRRMCPGTGLGSVMVHTVLAHMLQNFDWSLPAGDAHRDPRDLDVTELFVGVLNRKTPLELVATPKCLATVY